MSEVRPKSEAGGLIGVDDVELEIEDGRSEPGLSDGARRVIKEQEQKLIAERESALKEREKMKALDSQIRESRFKLGAVNEAIDQNYSTYIQYKDSIQAPERAELIFTDHIKPLLKKRAVLQEKLADLNSQRTGISRPEVNTSKLRESQLNRWESRSLVAGHEKGSSDVSYEREKVPTLSSFSSSEREQIKKSYFEKKEVPKTEYESHLAELRQAIGSRKGGTNIVDMLNSHFTFDENGNVIVAKELEKEETLKIIEFERKYAEEQSKTLEKAKSTAKELLEEERESNKTFKEEHPFLMLFPLTAPFILMYLAHCEKEAKKKFLSIANAGITATEVAYNSSESARRNLFGNPSSSSSPNTLARNISEARFGASAFRLADKNINLERSNLEQEHERESAVKSSKLSYRSV